MTDRQTDRQTSNNYNSIDLFKFVSSFLVIAIHTNIFASVSESFNNNFVNGFCRLAVYFYFITSAYFFFNGLRFENGKIAKDKDNCQRLKKYMLRVVLLYLIWSAIYLAWYAFTGIREGWLSIYDIAWYGINTVLSSSYYHLWFLISLIYAIPIMYFLLRRMKAKHLIIISVVLYLIGLLYGSYSFVLGDHLPLAGVWKAISDKWPRILTVVFNVIPICSFALIKPKAIKNNMLLRALAVLAVVLFSVEFLLINKVTPSTVSAYLLLTIPATTFIFLAVKSVEINLESSYLLRKMSTVMYCVHPLVLGVVGLLTDTKAMNSIVLFGIVSNLSLIVSFALVWTSKKFKTFSLLKYLQ